MDRSEYLIGRLKDLRNHLSLSRSIPQYIIFKDEQLDALLLHRPTSIEELVKIKGFPAGGKRVTQWGEQLVSIFKSPETIEDIQVDIDSEGNVSLTVIPKKMNIFRGN